MPINWEFNGQKIIYTEANCDICRTEFSVDSEHPTHSHRIKDYTIISFEAADEDGDWDIEERFYLCPSCYNNILLSVRAVIKGEHKDA